MNKFLKKLPVALFGVSFFLGCTQAQEVKKEIKTEKEKTSYAVGASIGESFKQQELDIDLDALFLGLKEGVSGESRFSEAEIRELTGRFQSEARNRQEAKKDAMYLENQKAQKEFFEKIDKKEGIRSTQGGVRYEVVREGKGPKPDGTRKVKANYRGTLIDGTQFDSSYDKGVPLSFMPTQVIPGWGEALREMPVGSKWILYIPSSLAYGKNPPPGSQLEPGVPLIFEVELLEIEGE